MSTSALLRGARWRAGSFASLIALGTVLAGCGPSQPPGGAAGAGGPPGGAMPPMPVSVRTVALRDVPVLVEAVGQAEGSKDVEVRARVTGLIERQHYTEGDRVRAGAPLFAIERAPFENALAQARAALAQEQTRVEQARREAQRLKPLAAMQAIAQREADDAATALRTAEAGLAAAQSRVRDAELNLSYTAVTAPIAGIAGRAEKSQGSLVGPQDGLLTRVTQTDPIWVRFSFSEGELALLHAGRTAAGKAATVRMLAAGGSPQGPAGKLNYTGSTVDARLGTVQLRAEFPNADLAVLPGQFVRAQVQAGQQRAWLVPQAAVATGDQGKMVWTVQAGKAQPTPVEVGGWFGGDWIVTNGLKDGDAVIVDNLMKLRPGAPVQPQDAPAAGASGAARNPANTASGAAAAAASPSGPSAAAPPASARGSAPAAAPAPAAATAPR